MIKIDMETPNTCSNCRFQTVAFEGDLFMEHECYCIVAVESVEDYMDNGTKPDWCPLIEDKENNNG